MRRRRLVRAGHARTAGDRVSTAGLAVVMSVGLMLIAIVERTLLAGGIPPAVRLPVLTPPDALPARAAPAVPPTSPPAVVELEPQVRRLTAAERTGAARAAYGVQPGAQPLAAATRFTQDRTWAFGTSVIPVPDRVPAMPQVALFLAHWDGSRWRMALSGDVGFRMLLRVVPTTLLAAEEIRALARFSVGPTGAPHLMLPWRVGDSWTMTALPQGNRPLASLTFDGGDGRVLAAADGWLYRFCAVPTGAALVMIVHQNGLATVYNRLTGLNGQPDGTAVRQGDPVGRIGAEHPCGGAVPDRPGLQFGLRQGTGDVAFNSMVLGGWIFRENTSPFVGWAERGFSEVTTGGVLPNFGPVDPQILSVPRPVPTPS